jgi:anti-sigma B factor antagonist
VEERREGESVVEPELKVNVELAPDPPGSWPVLRVAGEVDIQTSPALQEHLQGVLDQGKSSIVVDLGEVTFLDSTGLSVLVVGLKRCQGAGGDMRIVSPQPNVRRVLEITGLIDVFHVQVPEEEGTSN